MGFETSSELWTGSLFRERGVEAVLGAHVTKVEPGVVHYETLDGEFHTLDFDFGMLLPPFGGVPLAAYDKNGEDISASMFAPSGFMKVDADYSGKPYAEWKAWVSPSLRRIRSANPAPRPMERSSRRLRRARVCRPA